MKKLITIVIALLSCLNIVDSKYANNQIIDYIKNTYLNKDYYITTNLDALKINEYKLKNYNSFVSDTDNFKPKNRQELLNVYYTVLNNGWDNFSFYCDKKYTNCLNDIEVISKDKVTFSYMNQLVHPFNSYSSIESNYSNNGRIDIKINKKYSVDDIKMIKDKMNELIINLNINSYNNVTDKIKVFHDYIANTNKYDSDRANKNNSKYHSDSAIGTLFEGMSVCSGYTDTLSIFLNMINVDNVRVSTENHIWNALKLDDNWYHIDLTWDDPITTNGQDIIVYDYYLITTSELNQKNDNEHKFNSSVYDYLK